MNRIMQTAARFDLFALAAIGVLLMTGPLSAACSKPDAPACAIETKPFATDKAADDCRKEMLGFRDAMDVYASCLGETSSGAEQAARAEYEDVRVRFNRRARGE